MPKAAFCGLPHSESEVYYVKVNAIGLRPLRSSISFPIEPCIERLAPCELGLIFIRLNLIQHGEFLSITFGGLQSGSWNLRLSTLFTASVIRDSK